MSAYATKIIHKSSDDVSRASHTHQVPQAALAQIGPVVRTIEPKTTTRSPAAAAVSSQPGLRERRYPTEAMPQTNTEVNITQAIGAW